MGNLLGIGRSREKDVDASVKPPFYGLLSSKVCDLLEKILMWTVYGFSKPDNYFLHGSFAPVDEFGPAKVISVVGDLPKCLNGEFVRAGPNPRLPPTAKYHWFDGDGMLHGLRIKDGNATYVSRFVRTSRLKQEEYWGTPKFRKIGDTVGKVGLAHLLIYLLRTKVGVLNTENGTGQANTALAYHNGKLLALHEGDKPYLIRVLQDGDLETTGRLDYDKRLNHHFTAHPKIDPVTGEMFTFGYDVEKLPHAQYRVISKDGQMQDAVPLTLSGPVMMHDFAITENYAVFVDSPIYFKPKDMVKENQEPLVFDKTKPLQVGILPRYAKNESQIKWFKFSSGAVIHNANAWEEGDEVILFSCRYAAIELRNFIDYDPVRAKREVGDLWEFRMNLKTGEATERKFSEFHSDFPRLNEEYVGRKSQYVYTSVFDEPVHITAIAKYDLTRQPELGLDKLRAGGSVAGVYWFGEGRAGSEPVFVPRTTERGADEDDGYLLTFVVDEKKRKSEVVVLNAKTMSSDPVAVITLPRMVPHGFHAIFVSEDELKSQRS